MASNISYQNINEAFPIAGKDQSSEGFRDNFDIIKTALSVAKDEIESLQVSVDNVPTITEISELVNDAGYLTAVDVKRIFPTLVEPSKTTLNSLVTPATPATVGTATTTLTLINSVLIHHFVKGQPVRVFGAGSTLTQIAAPDLDAVSRNGAVSGTTLVEYKICEFDYFTGKISPPSPARSQLVNLESFNSVNNISLTFTRRSANSGILIYRKIDTSVFELTAVLGPKDLEVSLQGTYIDYAVFDFNFWSLKNPSRNSYSTETGIIHFPIVAPIGGLLGWVDAVIDSVDIENHKIILTNSYFFNSQVTVAHDDTPVLQAAITSLVNSNQNVLKLGTKTYHVSSLLVPSNFSIIGQSKQTIIKKLHWSGNSTITNKMFKSVSDQLVTSVSIENVCIDGNMQNQYLVSDLIDDSNNYIIDLRGSDLTFNETIIKNTISGGISSRQSTNLTVTQCQIYNSGMSDRYAASPILADECDEILIASNVMKNFSEAADLSLTNIGSITGNVVNNCGSGILVFGSTKLVSSPNLILGPAGEFIPGPDIFNSEFNAVNISIDPNITFISDVYVYQENGQVFDLTANSASIAYKVNKLRKIDNVEEIGDEILISGASPISSFIGPDLSKGQFKFSIPSDKTTILKTTYSYSALKSIDEFHVGLIYRALLTEYSPTATITEALPVINVSGGDSTYTIQLSTIANLSVGFKVKLLGHGGTPSLSNALGTIEELVSSTNECVISYPDIEVTVAGTGGQIAVENTFILAKGKIT